LITSDNTTVGHNNIRGFQFITKLAVNPMLSVTAELILGSDRLAYTGI